MDYYSIFDSSYVMDVAFSHLIKLLIESNLHLPYYISNALVTSNSWLVEFKLFELFKKRIFMTIFS